jgi:hypothetical protein
LVSIALAPPFGLSLPSFEAGLPLLEERGDALGLVLRRVHDAPGLGLDREPLREVEVVALVHGFLDRSVERDDDQHAITLALDEEGLERHAIGSPSGNDASGLGEPPYPPASWSTSPMIPPRTRRRKGTRAPRAGERGVPGLQRRMV